MAKGLSTNHKPHDKWATLPQLQFVVLYYTGFFSFAVGMNIALKLNTLAV